MSDYNLQVAWSGKDALGDTDPDKVKRFIETVKEYSSI